jgi:hypothetical protein
MSEYNSRSFSLPIVDQSEVKFGDHDNEGALKDAIIDLYLNVKVRNSEDVRDLLS